MNAPPPALDRLRKFFFFEALELLCGHVLRFMQTRLGSTLLCTAPSTAAADRSAAATGS